MPWIRIDDHFDEHPKLAAVGPVGWGVWLAGLSYCNRNLTDGFIPYSVAEGIGGSWKIRLPVKDDAGIEEVWSIDRGSGMHGESMDTQWVIDLLVGTGLWECVVGGYRVHDYGDYQPTKAQVLAERAAKVAAGRAGAAAAARTRAEAAAATGVEAPTPAKPQPNPKPVPTPVSGPTPRVNSPPTPPPAGGLRVNGTNPRAVAEQVRLEEREQRRKASHAIHMRYRRGEITEAEEQRLYAELDMEPDDLRRKEVPA